MVEMVRGSSIFNSLHITSVAPSVLPSNQNLHRTPGSFTMRSCFTGGLFGGITHSFFCTVYPWPSSQV